MFETLESRCLLSGGLQGVYYNNSNFTGAAVARIDPVISFNWGSGPPAPGLSSDTDSARWTGKVKPAYTERYTFKTISDDGVRLWINHKLLIDTWQQTGLATHVGSINLTAAKNYDIQLEYREKTGAASIQLRWSSASVADSIIPSSRLTPAAQSLRHKIDHAIAFAYQQARFTLADLAGNTSAYPSITPTNTTWQTVTNTDWTSGFFGGVLWQLYNRTLDKAWRLSATSYTTGLAAVKTAGDDLGFRFNPTYRQLYTAMQNPADRQVLIDAAASKVATWNSTVGMFKSVDFRLSTSGNPQANFPVLIDHNMDLELVYWAAKQTGHQDWIDKANAHLAKVAQYFIRADGGTIQWGYFYDKTGAFVSGETRQGLSNTSTWARGQTWLIYTLTNAYAETGRADFLAAAKKVANYYLAHLPADSIPYWDFNAPVTSTPPRDSSAAAVAASALLKLASLIPADPDSAAYRQASYNTIASLISPTYLTDGTGSRGILAHGAKYVAQGYSDNSLIYGDYYLLEALNRYSVL